MLDYEKYGLFKGKRLCLNQPKYKALGLSKFASIFKDN